MKNKLFNMVVPLIAVILFSGCYTQLAVKETASQKERRDYSYYEDENYDSSYSDENSERDYSYQDDADIVINKYYYGFYPSYRRYFWSYHPSIVIGIGWGSWYYDPFYYYPVFYWSWCGACWYYPTYYYSYYPFYYPPYYYYWGSGGWGYYDNYKYRERTRDIYSIRNNSGLRNSFVTRDIMTRTDSRSLNKDSRLGERTREVSVDRNTTSRNREFDRQKTNRENERTDLKREERKKDQVLEDYRKRDNNNSRNNSGNKQIETRKRYEEIFRDRSKENYSTPPQKEDNRRQKVDTNKSPEVKKDNSIKRERTDTRTKNETRIERRTQETPRKYSPPPQRTYSPPTNNTPPPRTSNPPSGSSQDGGRRR